MFGICIRIGAGISSRSETVSGRPTRMNSASVEADHPDVILRTGDVTSTKPTLTMGLIKVNGGLIRLYTFRSLSRLKLFFSTKIVIFHVFWGNAIYISV